jgi:PleD family two-component response regulator
VVVGIDNAPRRGSTFWLTAKFSVNPAISCRSAVIKWLRCRAFVAERVAGRRILLVEDEPINREVAEMLLDDVGLVVEMAVDGVEALEKISQQDYDSC